MESPKHDRTINRLIFIALTLYGLGFALHRIFFHAYDSIASSKEANLELACRIVRDIGWYCAIVLAVTYGIFLWRIYGIRPALKYLSGGILGFTFTGLSVLYALSSLQSLQSYLASSPHTELIVQQAYDDTTLPLDRRHKITKYYARTTFISGEIPPKYIGIDGELKSYVPTPDEQKMHDKALDSKKLTEWVIDAMYGSIRLTIGAFLLSCTVGLFASAFYKRKLT